MPGTVNRGVRGQLDRAKVGEARPYSPNWSLMRDQVAGRMASPEQVDMQGLSPRVYPPAEKRADAMTLECSYGGSTLVSNDQQSAIFAA